MFLLLAQYLGWQKFFIKYLPPPAVFYKEFKNVVFRKVSNFHARYKAPASLPWFDPQHCIVPQAPSGTTKSEVQESLARATKLQIVTWEVLPNAPKKIKENTNHQATLELCFLF